MRIIVTLLLLIGLSACQTIKHKQLHQNWDEVNSWSLSGKMAINDGKQNGSGKFNWKVSPTHLEAQFKAPLGQGSWKIIEDNYQAQLISSKHPDKYAADAQILISNELGWTFPLKKLKYWLRGFEYLQTPKKHKKNIDTIADSEWQISYQRWEHTPMGLLPTKIKASKPPYSVKLIIYHWNFD
jgi:outer membrane lipoprotein LolB